MPDDWQFKFNKSNGFRLITLKRLGGQIDLKILKSYFLETVKPWFFVAFNIIIRHTFPENFIEILQVVWKL